MKWYFVLNSTAHRLYIESAKVSVQTCLSHTSLQPHALYDGPEDAFVAWLRARGVVVHFHTVPFLATMMKNSGVRALRPHAARGAYLRVMIPEVEMQDEFVLYTDCDVMFQHDPVPELSRLRPRFIGAAPEADITDLSFFNSGVMLLNVSACRRKLSNFVRFIEDNIPHWFGFSPNDQGALNYFFRGTWEPIDPKFNWKPYWGIDPQAWIIHQHGNRPTEVIIQSQLGVSPTERSETRKRVFSDPKSVEGLRHYAKKYYAYLRDIAEVKTELRQAVLSGDTLDIVLTCGEEIRDARYCVLLLFSGAELVGELGLPVDPRKKLRAELRYSVSIAPCKVADSERLTLTGRDLVWMTKDVTRSAAEASIDSGAVNGTFTPTQHLRTLVAAEPPQSERAEIPGGRVRRIWVLHNTNFRLVSDGKGTVEQIPAENIAPSRLTFGPISVESEPSSEGEVAQIVEDRILVDLKMSAPERVFAAVAQLAAFDAFESERPRSFKVESDATLEREVVNLFPAVSAEISAHRPARDAAIIRRCAGRGILAHAGSPVIDMFIRRHLPRDEEDAPRAILGSSKSLTSNVLKDFAGALAVEGYSAVDLLDMPTGRQLRTISRAPLIVVTDKAMAPLLAIAAPHAAVIDIVEGASNRDPSSDVVRHVCSMRNLLYSRVELPPEGSEYPLKELLDMVAKLATILLQSNAKTSGPITR